MTTNAVLHRSSQCVCVPITAISTWVFCIARLLPKNVDDFTYVSSSFLSFTSFVFPLTVFGRFVRQRSTCICVCGTRCGEIMSCVGPKRNSATVSMCAGFGRPKWETKFQNSLRHQHVSTHMSNRFVRNNNKTLYENLNDCNTHTQRRLQIDCCRVNEGARTRVHTPHTSQKMQ